VTDRAVTPLGRWFQPDRTRQDAAARLFAFPHAGGAAVAYSGWLAVVPGDVELKLVQLPGRHDRRSEPAFTEFEPLLDALFEAFVAESDGRPYGLFGHSLGGVLAYRLTVALEAASEEGPVLLGVSGVAPGRPSRMATEMLASVALPDDQFAAKATELGMLPPQIRASPEMMGFVLPVLRADLSVVADMATVGDTKVSCPIAAYQGSDDPLLLPSAMASWSDRTPTFLGVSEFPGGHFYFDEHAMGVGTDLARHLRRLAG
jgi:surfactin synthase thioesterase subunit